MPFCRLYYHLVWTTQDRQPTITKDIEYKLHGAIKNKVRSLGGTAYEVNGTEDHVHSVVSIPPTIAVSRFIGEVKGVSSFHINHVPGSSQNLAWEPGYGAVTFRRENLEQVLAYVRNQKKHHAEGKIWRSLEVSEEEDASSPMRVEEELSEYDSTCW